MSVPASTARKISSFPKEAVCPTQSLPVHIAEAVWLPVYGKSIDEERPFVAELIGDSLWIVEGSLPKQMLGGVPYIEIQKKDGKILGMIHGQ